MKKFIKLNYFKKKNYLDLIKENKLSNHNLASINLWGRYLHKKNIKKKNILHIEKVLNTLNFKLKKNIENFLEIGCGEGNDILFVKKRINPKNIYCTDIGENIKVLSNRKEYKKINFIRCDCLQLPFEKNYFDLVYSYGVFHHTENLELAIKKAKFVLKKNGLLIFYNYKKHSNIIKKIGIYSEKIIMIIFSKLNIKMKILFCYIISPFILILFSYPSKILKIFGSKKIYKKIPLWWGSYPKDIINDLIDRLCAPINIRLTKKEMILILKNIKFNKIKVLENNDGLICMVKK